MKPHSHDTMILQMIHTEFTSFSTRLGQKTKNKTKTKTRGHWIWDRRGARGRCEKSVSGVHRGLGRSRKWLIWWCDHQPSFSGHVMLYLNEEIERGLKVFLGWWKQNFTITGFVPNTFRGKNFPYWTTFSSSPESAIKSIRPVMSSFHFNFVKYWPCSSIVGFFRFHDIMKPFTVAVRISFLKFTDWFHGVIIDHNYHL